MQGQSIDSEGESKSASLISLSSLSDIQPGSSAYPDSASSSWGPNDADSSSRGAKAAAEPSTNVHEAGEAALANDIADEAQTLHAEDKAAVRAAAHAVQAVKKDAGEAQESMPTEKQLKASAGMQIGKPPLSAPAKKGEVVDALPTLQEYIRQCGAHCLSQAKSLMRVDLSPQVPE